MTTTNVNVEDTLRQPWDKNTAHFLRSIGLTVEQVGAVLGLVAEHRQASDRIGYMRAVNEGGILR